MDSLLKLDTLDGHLPEGAVFSESFLRSKNGDNPPHTMQAGISHLAHPLAAKI
jgi:hypothetical protein